MAKSMITATDGGFDAWIDEIDSAAEHIPELMLEALKARQAVAEKAIQKEWTTMVGGQPNGFVYSSVGQSANYSKLNPRDVVGTVGVYDIDSVKAAFGKTSKDLNAAQLAYWAENGTSRLRIGGRKKKGVQYPDDMLVTVAPKPFITTAVYRSWSEAEKAFRETFNSAYKRLVK